MIDFTNCEINRFKAYSGANGQKIHIIYNGVGYMLKFPPAANRNPAMSYSNGCLSEYLACHIFESLGFKTQETLLGTYTVGNGKEKVVVACRDFAVDGKKLMEFAQLKNTCIDSEQNGYGTELDSILAALEEQQLYPPDKLKDFFWEMFIADAFLGNFDRHNGNWGLLVDEAARTVEIAPIYDCGSCLYPQLDAEHMEAVINDEAEIANRIFKFPTSAIEQAGRKINYFGFIFSHANKDCTAALERVGRRIDMEAISTIIDDTPFLEPIQRDFYKIMLQERYDRIILQSLEMLREHDLTQPTDIQM